MKKMFFVLIFCLTFISAFGWEVLNEVDEFEDPTGKKELAYKVAKNRYISIKPKDETGYYPMTVIFDDAKKMTAMESKTVRVKVDAMGPFEYYGTVFCNMAFVIFVEKELLDLMAKGKEIKFSIPDEDDFYHLEKFSLKGFKAKYEEAVNKME